MPRDSRPSDRQAVGDLSDEERGYATHATWHRPDFRAGLERASSVIDMLRSAVSVSHAERLPVRPRTQPTLPVVTGSIGRINKRADPARALGMVRLIAEFGEPIARFANTGLGSL
jgi:hypothetical protein